jgi:4-hydroxy-4-methyl-2-oxoglutarate aldolase
MTMTKRKLLSLLAAGAAAALLAWPMLKTPVGAASGDPLVEEFKLVALASVSDAVDEVVGKRGFLDHSMRPVIPGKFAGRAVTAKLVPKDKAASTAATAVSHSVQMIDGANPGDVGVIVIEDGLNVAAVGGLMMTAAKARGMAGMVLDGAARDVPELRMLGVPVYARSYSPATAVGRYVSVFKNEPVECAGVLITPGDIIVADEDGVVVVPQAHAKKVLEAAQVIDEKEGAMVPLIKKLKSLTEVIAKFNRI